MKKFILKPGFELVFALSLMVVLGLPPVLLAQNPKELEIKIENGDTTINGKNIKNLSATERESALKDIKYLSSGLGDNTKLRIYSFRRTDSLTKTRPGANYTYRHRMMKDSAGKVTEITIDDNAPGRAMLGGRNIAPPLRPGMRGADRRNSQTFNYVTTDKEGISTRVSFSVSEASNDDLKRVPHVEGAKFEIEDLNIVPEFTSGKTLLLFKLSEKTAAEAKLIDSDGRMLWSEKFTGGSFSKSFSMGLNGIYYLHIKQGNNNSVKRIVKME